ncbi:biotin-independent malonate decarboxylase subunit beta [Alteribacillus bidgolensis]|uniref:Malonate decarboxylase beta subunit n=1 Tax=Alteribacillus bidgolensis TaxID=930129 RepID=A0A1G8KHQ1_9BACI|nr:biotin-independent malonate decarboxylase subunit beta [Alteribacillus bidgolensis]SDI42949.1 malonate decarboxylase beta subunit [Alteribacillus bidgolensis]
MKLNIKESLAELNARERVKALVDKGSFHEFLGPFDGKESPHLAAQGVVPQSDDGVVAGKGTIDGLSCVMIAMEGDFQGGGIGEVAGSKIAAALELALKDNKNGTPTHAVIIFDTGGVRLQEANYGLLTIAEIHAAITALREYSPVIGVIPGKIGAFGGMAISAGLCSTLIMTKEGRLCLNGPEVIEQEAGIAEFDSKDRLLVWRTIGGMQRTTTGFADVLTEDEATIIKEHISDVFSKKQIDVPRSANVEKFLSIVNTIDPSFKYTPEGFQHVAAETKNKCNNHKVGQQGTKKSRGEIWFEAFTGKSAIDMHEVPSVLCGEGTINNEKASFLSVVPDEEGRFPRARNGEVGLEQGWMLAKYVREIMEEDKGSDKRPIVAIVDVPSQAYGYNEELAGIYLSCAAAVDAYAAARRAGHPVIALIVGKAISGAFLSHGLQANRILALDDENVQVQVMSKQSAARITLRTIEQVEEAAKKVPATAYDVRSFAALGGLQELIQDIEPEQPEKEDVASVEKTLRKTVNDIKKSNAGLEHRLNTPEALSGGRKASIEVRKLMEEQWK